MISFILFIVGGVIIVISAILCLYQKVHLVDPLLAIGFFLFLIASWFSDIYEFEDEKIFCTGALILASLIYFHSFIRCMKKKKK